MQLLRIVASSGLVALSFAAAEAAPAIAADRQAPLIELAQAPPAAQEEDDKRKGRREGKDGERGERRGGEGRGEARGESRGEGRGEGRGGEGRERGEGRGDRGGAPDAKPAQQVTPPPPPPQRQVTPPPTPPVQQRQAEPPPQQQVTPPQATPRAERPDKLQDLKDRMRERVQAPNRGDGLNDDRRGSDRRDERDNRGGRDRDNRFGRDRDRDDRDNRRAPVQVEERRGPPPVQAEPRRLDTFKDRFRSRVGEDKAFQDLRRGRDERVRERRERTREATPFRGIEELKSKRRERREGGAVVIEEPDKRSIIREGNRSIIRTDENERLRRNFRDVRREKRNGRDVTIAIGAGGVQIFTDFDDDGRPRRRWRRGADGRDVVLFDNSRSRGWGRGRRGGLFDAIIDLPPPRLRIPRDEYIVDYDRASEDDLYDALSAPPVEEIDEGYSIDEIRSSYSLRDRMRRIDLDTINFAFGSWEVEEQDYDRLERVARAMRRVLRRNADEMFLIEGHTDAVGSDDDNLTLSDRRAESVARILSEEFQIPAENLTTQGYGEQFLKIDTSEPERANRRVAIRRITPLLAR